MKRFLVILLSLTLCLSAFLPLTVHAEQSAELADDVVGKLDGETDRVVQNVTVDGKDTGVQIHTITLSGTYGNKEVWVATGDLSNTNLSVEVINGGQYMVSGETMMKASADYNAAHPGQTVLAAVNGDLWMTSVHSNDKVTTKVLKVPRGFTMIDGEIWATQQIGMENYVATNGEKGTTSPDKASFGITATNQPLVGIPIVDITVKNETKSKNFAADGINRLPAHNSLIVYNYRCNDTNYALSDSYEIEIEVESSAFTVDGQVKGTVKAIYPANSSTRPTFNEKNVVLTARGNRINDLKNNFAVGDTVSFSLNLTDKLGNTALWQTVEDAIGGHMITLNDGKIFSPNGNNSEYPTTLIGYNNDGKVMMLTINAQESGKYLGLNFTKGVQFCQELGYNSVFYMDGGGSATFVSMEEGESGATYVARNKGSDPLKDDNGNVIGSSQRAVINGVGFVWNDTPVCEKQGSLEHIEYPLFDYGDISTEYVCGELMAEFMGGHNAVDTYYDAEAGGMVVKLNTNSNDPYAAFDMTSLGQISADEYKYIVLRVKTDRTTVNSSTSAIFYACGNTMGAVGGQTVYYEIPKGDQWNWIIIDMNKKHGWAGKINNLRFDIFDGPMIDKGLSVTFSVLAFAKTKEDAQKLTEGYIPEGCIADFGTFKQKLVDVHNVKKALDTMSKDAAMLAESGMTALDAAKALENANEKTPAIYAEAVALLDKVKAGMDAIDAAKASAQNLTNEVEDAKALEAQAQEALTAMQADAEALTAKVEELAQVAAETEPPTTEEPTTEVPTTEPESEPDSAKPSGCKSFVGAGIMVMITLLGAAFVGRKRD
jgi:hypothetical protein